MPIRSLPEMVSRVVRILQQDASQITMEASPLYQSIVVDELNSVYEAMSQEAAAHVRPELLHSMDLEVIDAATGLCDLKLPVFTGRALLVTERSLSTTEIGEDERKAVQARVMNADAILASPRYRIEANGAIRILPGARETLYWRLWFIRVPAHLHAGTASAGTVNSVTFPATPTYGALLPFTDAYKWETVYLYAGTGAGQLAKVTAYNASTRVATVENLTTSRSGYNAFSTAPGSGTSYSMQPWFPPEFTEYLCARAASRFTRFQSAFDAARMVAELDPAWREWLSALDAVTPNTVIRTGSVGDFFPAAGESGDDLF